MLALSMNGTYETRSRWVDKIAFFGLFIAVLLIAHFIVIQRSALVLSEPIELNCAGLSVCIPTGNGWRSENQWKYQQNALTLDSFFSPNPGSITAIVSCRYQLAATKDAPGVLFEKKASAIGGAEIARTGQINMTEPAEGQQAKSIAAIDWAHIKGSKTLFDTFFGIAQLPNNRRLDIEVYQTTGDTDQAERIFNSVINSIKFANNPLLEAGGKIVTEIKDRGLDSLLASVGNKQGQDRETFFLINDATGKSIGFTMEVLRSLKPGRFGAMSYYYIRGQRDQEQVTSFQSDNNLNEFAWKSETSGPGGRSGAEITLGKDGIMTVKEFGLRAKEKDYQIGPAAIPDVVSEFTFNQMLDSDQKEIFVDIIEADGKITPSLVSRIEASPSLVSQNRSSGTDVAQEETAYVFRVELLDGRGFSQQVHLDDQRRILRILSQQESTYTIERTDAENIAREFPKQGSDILQKKDIILEQNQPQESNEP
jgi:hypothetical protein